ncbi:DUF5335 family protein [Myxococcus sp. CA051A]|uniref:Uncharacterized protein n=1 Tax=Myxococcus llanfairpwllgwyngyllgogerychwyrndrobwllllantysiliogogogochensis TaxID=2590453 RepID=A0A540WJW5_9BACT|nr:MULTISPECIES: DUF5335 family protein [Myxococcus]NTX05319.1 DUF5335 family protein [Myxococcus sp. CA040A]NTX09944.1 DUF5335 family protein [Myxococcus sp. CA056]NTX35307.1 DUF5335 family protein [Myxococcus sp. CA033]NTX55190.1 DUF5335 family protein [Myxococcus sp. CA039A]NTX64406.1 DUF5335 family protein [Myxococcus sp. CA051A]
MAHTDHTREIPREGWADYLALLSTMEKEHPVRIEVEGMELGDQPLAEGLPLVEISLEEKGSDKGVVEIIVGGPGGEITHRIQKPERIYADESESGELECLDIESSEDNTKTLIYFGEALTAGARNMD